MTLKPIVVSLALLGLAGTAFAGGTDDNGSLEDRVAALEAAINQNNVGDANTVADHSGWADRISIGGVIAADGTYTNRDVLGGSDATRTGFAVNDAYLYLDARANDWTTAHLSINYDDNALTGNGHTLRADEAYVTLSNFASQPWYGRVGREYLPYGQYDVHTITRTLTQQLTETNDVAGTVGYMHSSGLNLSGTVFKGDLRNTAVDSKFNNWVAHVGYANEFNNIGFNAGVDYMANVIDVTDINTALRIANAYSKRVGGVAAYVTANSGPFDGTVRFTGTRRFHENDLLSSKDGTSGAKLRAWDVEAGYSFNAMNYDSRVSVGYQASRDAGYVRSGTTMYVPKSRIIGDLTVGVWENTDLTLEVLRNKDYGTNNNGTGRKQTAGTLRLSVKFA